ncbi:MAG TPA: hypothetical protein VKZ98_12380 [Aquaticitalea sp.]|nr:hypothetical protein [Aquaticitalea sp.]
MNPILKNMLAIVAGIIVGSIVNMTLITISGAIIAPPGGANVSTMEGLKESIHLFEPKHFIFPFLAHAFGTLAGAFIAARIAINHKMIFAIVIGLFFMVGGAMNVMVLPSPPWFNVLDLVCAYLPMAWVGGKWAMGRETLK